MGTVKQWRKLSWRSRRLCQALQIFSQCWSQHTSGESLNGVPSNLHCFKTVSRKIEVVLILPWDKSLGLVNLLNYVSAQCFDWMAPHVSYVSFPWERFSFASHVPLCWQWARVSLGHPRGEQRAPPAGQGSEGTGKENWAEAGSCLAKFTVAFSDE